MSGWIQEITVKPNLLNIQSITDPTFIDYEVNGQTINVQFVSLTSGYRIAIGDQKYICDTPTGIAIVGKLNLLSRNLEDDSRELEKFVSDMESFKVSEF